MKALTLYQPWASLIACRVKTIETRPWATKYRGSLAIHAAMRRPFMPNAIGHSESFQESPHSVEYQLPSVSGGIGTGEFILLPEGLVLPFGAVVATCELLDVVPTERVAFADDTDPWVVEKGWQRCRGDFDYLVSRAQQPYGDYEPGRFAWILGCVVPLDEPVPATGRQQLWNWDPS
jgi:hypothetical protein